MSTAKAPEATRAQILALVETGLCDAEIGMRFGGTRSLGTTLRRRFRIKAKIKRGRSAGDPRNDGGREAKLGSKHSEATIEAIRATMKLRCAEKRAAGSAQTVPQGCETVEAFLARGGKITLCAPFMAAGAETLTRIVPNFRLQPRAVRYG